jgi:hypothetical protein
MADMDRQAAIRDLRTRIARRRRRIDRRIRNTQRAVAELRDWRTYVRRFPGPALLAAFGGGLLASRGATWRMPSRWLAAWAARRAWATVKAGVGSELAALWAAAGDVESGAAERAGNAGGASKP